MADRPTRFIVAVVDDDRSILRSLECLLDPADYAAHPFRSARALLDSGRLLEIDCLILDVDMPGMEDFELLARIHSARPALPTILITGYPERLNLLPLLDGIYPALFTKPVEARELFVAVSAIRRFSRRRGAE